ncbi:hypothetical protein L596_000986 [Steinernema carpocapsae]|uniref:Chitin synthase n=1 Tax=Steinernema carpocapsae TaxID=34508 RepID=A0A4V6I6Z5_STECR|nr:hypothetical protein L596_000986 [Steinernema carpocapsae]
MVPHVLITGTLITKTLLHLLSSNIIPEPTFVVDRRMVSVSFFQDRITNYQFAILLIQAIPDVISVLRGIYCLFTRVQQGNVITMAIHPLGRGSCIRPCDVLPASGTFAGPHPFRRPCLGAYSGHPEPRRHLGRLVRTLSWSTMPGNTRMWLFALVLPPYYVLLTVLCNCLHYQPFPAASHDLSLRDCVSIARIVGVLDRQERRSDRTCGGGRQLLHALTRRGSWRLWGLAMSQTAGEQPEGTTGHLLTVTLIVYVLWTIIHLFNRQGPARNKSQNVMARKKTTFCTKETHLDPLHMRDDVARDEERDGADDQVHHPVIHLQLFELLIELTTVDEDAVAAEGERILVTTPYGGRLVMQLPAGTLLFVHLKDKKLMRHKKRGPRRDGLVPEVRVCHRHWFQKAAEHVFGCVLCAPGCFSLFRASALMDDNIMHKYTKMATDQGQYDQGEDRWLSTAIGSNTTPARTPRPTLPKDEEFFNQRRRWTPSSVANTIDLLADYKRASQNNDSISKLYIIYQMLVIGFSLLGPAIIFAMLVFAQVAAFGTDPTWIMVYNTVPVSLFIAACFVFESKWQLLFAKIASVVYAFIMLAVLVATSSQIVLETAFSPTSIFVLAMIGIFFVAALLHPHEFYNIIFGLIFFLMIPSTYVFLSFYALINLNVINWGTAKRSRRQPPGEGEKEGGEVELDDEVGGDDGYHRTDVPVLWTIQREGRLGQAGQQAGQVGRVDRENGEGRRPHSEGDEGRRSFGRQQR